jgi:hypothetical protein
MKTLTHCPKCHGPLLSEYIGNRGLGLLWKKDCYSFVDHRFYSRSSASDENKLYDMQVSITMNPYTYANWNFFYNDLDIRKKVDSDELLRPLIIPYFDPEPLINDYDKLINKIKTLIIFS